VRKGEWPAADRPIAALGHTAVETRSISVYAAGVSPHPRVRGLPMMIFTAAGDVSGTMAAVVASVA